MTSWRGTLIVTCLVPFVFACATGKKSRRTPLDSCERARAQCGAELEEARTRIKGLEALIEVREDELDIARRRLEAYRTGARRLSAEFQGGPLEVSLRRGRLVVELPNKLLFERGEAEVKPEGAKAIEKLAETLASLPKRRFLVAGHTDTVPVSKKNKRYTTNWELSTQRALAVLLLLEKSGVPSEQLAAAGYGEFDPKASNDSEESRQQNRRTEIILMPTLDEVPPLPEAL